MFASRIIQLRTKTFSRSYSSTPSTIPASKPKPMDQIPGPPVHPDRGTLDDFLLRVQKTAYAETMNSYYYDYGTIVRQRLDGKDEVWLYDPADILHVFKNDNVYPTGLVSILWPIHEYGEKRKRKFPLLGDGNEEWKKIRSILQKDIFPTTAAASFTPIFNVPAAAASKVFNRGPFDQLTPYASFDMFCSALFGENFFSTERSLDHNRIRDDTDKFVEATMAASRDLVGLTIFHDRSPEKIAMFEERMDMTMQRGEKILIEKSKRPDFGKGISYYERIVKNHEISWEEILNSLTIFLMAGVDNTTNVTLWLLLNLGRNPKVQEKLYQEIMEVVGDGPVTEEHLEKLEYMRQVFRESHRLTPLLPGSTFRVLDHPLEVSGYEIPAGITFHFGIAAIQKDPRYVENPEEFIPERWSKEAVAKRKGTPQEIIDTLVIAKPFGYGPRMCIGYRIAQNEIRVLLCHLLRDWKFSWDPNHQKYKSELQVGMRAVPYPRMTMEPRKK